MIQEIQNNIKKNLALARGNMLEYSMRQGISSEDITLVAVSKYFPEDYISIANDYGQIDFGESRVQELIAKQESLDLDINWHFIGHLQTNKVKYLLNRVKLLHSLDRLKLAKEIDIQCGNAETSMDALIQVNISKESTKSGIYQEDVYEFIEKVSEYKNVRIKGLMTMAPNTDDTSEIIKCFSTLRKIFDEFANQDLPTNIEMKYISMGMSNDYKLALQEGSNMIRVGSGIFKD